MIVSHKHHFIFFHTPKVAGSSVVKLLLEDLQHPLKAGARKVAKRAGIKPKRKYDVHETALGARKILPPHVFYGYLKFALVRNPWDWHVSHYHFVRSTVHHFRHEEFKAFSGFDEYVDWVTGNLYTQHERLADESGNLLVDFIGRFETLQDDFDRVFRLLGLPPMNLAHVNRSRHKDYRTYYTPRTRDLIAEARRIDIETFGYDFDGLRNDVEIVRAFSPRALQEAVDLGEAWEAPRAARRTRSRA